jgi:enoyl-CoA hydratase/carnithine racemase
LISLRLSENATCNRGFFDKAMALCESMPKPLIAAISGTALAGAIIKVSHAGA